MSERPYPVHWEADVVLRDGGTAHIRPIGPADAGRLVDFYEKVSDESKYYRFFAPYPRLSDRDVHRFTHHDYDDRVGLAAIVGDEFIATVRYDRTDEQGRAVAGRSGTRAEVAFLVQDAHQGRGVASALLEHIGAVARERGILHFTAEVLPANRKMVKVFTDAGYTQQRSFADGVVHLDLDLEPTDESVQVMRAREHRAEARSVQRLLRPDSVAVVGTGRRPGGVGRTLLRNLVAGGFTGRLYAVNHAFPESGADLDGVPGHRSVRGIGAPVDLAVIAVGADRVPEAVADCGAAGVRGLVVVADGYSETGPEGRTRQRDLVRQARGYGMRVIGPNAFGVVNTAADVRLNASLSPEMPHRGRLGLFTQSGAIGIALLSGLHRRGVGPSTFVSAGNRADVSGNDLLQFWQDDPETDAVLMYLESFGNPRKFTRLARKAAAAKPVVVVKGALHTGAVPAGHSVPVARIPDSTVSALFRQAGVMRVATVTELLDAGLFLALQPLPAGDRVAIVGNSDSLGLLTYDAALTAGLRPAAPRDLTTAATPEDFAAALTAALADPGCDAVRGHRDPPGGHGDPGPHAGARPRALPERYGNPERHGVPERHGDPERHGAPGPRRAAGRRGAPRPRAGARPRVRRRPGPRRRPAPGRRRRRQARGRRLPRAGRPGRPARRARRPGRPYPRLPRARPGGGHARRGRRVRRLAGGRRPSPAGCRRWRTSRRRPRPRTYGGCCPRGRRPARRSRSATRTRRPCWAGTASRSTARCPPPTPARPSPPRPGSATRSPSRRPRRTCGTAPTSAAYGSTWPTRAICAGRTANSPPGSAAPAELLPVVQAMAPRGVDTVVRAGMDPAAGAVLSFGLAGAPSELLGRHRAPTGSGHRPGRGGTGALDQGRAPALRLARLGTGGHRGPGGPAAAGVAARRRPARGGGRRPGTRRGRGPRAERARRDRTAGPAARPHRPRPARPVVVLTGRRTRAAGRPSPRHGDLAVMGRP